MIFVEFEVITGTLFRLVGDRAANTFQFFAVADAALGAGVFHFLIRVVVMVTSDVKVDRKFEMDMSRICLRTNAEQTGRHSALLMGGDES